MSRAAAAIGALREAGLTVATCESLTAGLVAGELATVPGASAVLRGGLITYATQLKAVLAGVDPSLLAARGAVDPEVAEQMALGAARVCGADIGLACTGVAGPEPQDGRPVGLVYTALARGGRARAHEHRFGGDRVAIRAATVAALLERAARLR
ncbi:CinA family protein [Brevibacterium sp. BRM-1]|uniref:CinA family protein n=1 Tax=Brevibacterium sp. BRM-1 TaxID=2999062 RepID=UPI0022813F5F|nr:CinA family protein [Brevibacterium sp. BRM-1]WAL41219.1 CinA family protein [Brevibacterium sp. BRM-1]